MRKYHWFAVAVLCIAVAGQAMASCPAAAPALSSPANNATVPPGNVTLSWLPVPNATSYEVFVGLFGATPSSHGSVAGTSKTFNINAGTVVEWYVSTQAPSCPPMASSSRTFTASGPSCPDGVASLTGPGSGASFSAGTAIDFNWTAVPFAQNYDLKVNDGGGWRVLGTTTRTHSTETLPVGEYEWEVRTNFANDCESTYSTTRTFEITPAAECPTDDPALLSPAAGASNVPNPVHFNWEPVLGAVKYGLFVSIDGGPVSLLTTATGTSFDATLSGSSVLWAVSAMFDGNCPEVRSEARRFTLSHECGTATVQLLQPPNNDTVDSPVTLTWTPVANAVAYRVWMAIDGAAPVNIVKVATATATVSVPSGRIAWYVEALRTGCDAVVSDRREFTVRGGNCANKPAPTLISPIGTAAAPVQVTSPVDLRWAPVDGAIGYRVWLMSEGQPFEDIGLTRETHLLRTLDADRYEWFVQVLYAGCDAVASAHGHFEIQRLKPQCSTQAPAILAPAEGASTSSPVTFRWTGLEEADSYRLYVSIDDGEPILIGKTEETTLTRVLPPGKIVWRVEAVFEDCPSTFSPRAQFTMERAQKCSSERPLLLSPVPDFSAPAGPVQFSWQPLVGAVRYIVVLRVGDGSPTPIAETEQTSIERKLPVGRYTWSVLAFVAGCEPTEAVERRFTLTSPAECADNRAPILFAPSDRHSGVASPAHFDWSAVPRARGYHVWVAEGDGQASIIASTKETFADVALPPGRYSTFVEALFDSCPPTESASTHFTVSAAPAGCETPLRPLVQVIGQAISGTPYKVRWNNLPQVELYEIQESTTLDFAGATTRVVDGASTTILHDVTATTQYFYRVRGISNCSDDRGPFSDVVGVFVVPAQARNGSAEVGVEGNIVQQLELPGSPTPLQFVATVDKPWLTVTPSSGTLQPGGITLTVTANPSVLTLGTNTGTVTVSYSGAGKGGDVAGNATNVTTTPVSISIVTPITPSGKGTPPPDALIIPAVARAQGANDSFFESDIRVTNLGAQTSKYQITFTPSGSDGTLKGSSSIVEISPNQTLALDDVMATLFGTGSTSVIGMLEIRPISTSSVGVSPVSGGKATQISTIASSRTYNVTPTGTFGQYIPALPFSSFVGKSITSTPTILSLQQIAQSAQYRTNFGFAEGSGQPATLSMRVYDTHNNLLATIPVTLLAGEHKQINA
ncbi:MAG: large repetitive protein, partial [Acidobacteriota bacterium]|nr:large repetitive protein [Acidobacteriota bacterium]